MFLFCRSKFASLGPYHLECMFSHLRKLSRIRDGEYLGGKFEFGGQVFGGCPFFMNGCA